MFVRMLVDSVRFAVAGTMAGSAPPGAIRLRSFVMAKVAAGGLLGRFYHWLRIPFQFTPLLALPFALAGAFFFYHGFLWAGVLCSFLVTCSDMADGISQGYMVNHLPPAERPHLRMAMRRKLDSFVVDPACRFLFYGVFVLRLHQEQLVGAWFLAILLVIELANNLMSASASSSNRPDEFFYEFVLNKEGAARYRPWYPLRVVVGNLTAYHGYSVLPLLGYIWPLSQIGVTAFALVFAFRIIVFVGRIGPWLLSAAQSSVDHDSIPSLTLSPSAESDKVVH